MTPLSIATLLKTTRQYFWSKDFTEVEIPYLNLSLPLEPNLYTFKVNDWYLPASPEFALKAYLAKNKQNCFSIAHCFRNLESTSTWHTPEFLMLEYYLVNQNLSDLQESLKDYLSRFLNLKFINFKLPANLPANEPDFNQYFLNEIEPTLPQDKAVFITGYPAFLSPLAKSAVDNFSEHSDRDQVRAEPEGSEHRKNSSSSIRFELYINGIEIANGCEENRDIDSIRSAFLQEQKYRHENNLPLHPISEEFIQNCAALPPCCGLGLGLDRLLKVINLTK